MAVVAQAYVTHVNPESVILGNAIIVKCVVPSFVADFVQITGWVDESSDENFIYDELLGIPDFFGSRDHL